MPSRCAPPSGSSPCEWQRQSDSRRRQLHAFGFVQRICPDVNMMSASSRIYFRKTGDSFRVQTPSGQAPIISHIRRLKAPHMCTGKGLQPTRRVQIGANGHRLTLARASRRWPSCWRSESGAVIGRKLRVRGCQWVTVWASMGSAEIAGCLDSEAGI